jgi:hypothetical protein
VEAAKAMLVAVPAFAFGTALADYSPMVRPHLSMGLGSGPSGAPPVSCLLRRRATFTTRTNGLPSRIGLKADNRLASHRILRQITCATLCALPSRVARPPDELL